LYFHINYNFKTIFACKLLQQKKIHLLSGELKEILINDNFESTTVGVGASLSLMHQGIEV
jgi:hypothetical protein